MDEAKSAINTVELPTGVSDENEIHKVITFRELSGYEEDILASKKMKTSAKMSLLMSNCIIKFGEVEDRQKINKFVKKMLITDRWFFLTQLRSLSLGNVYEFLSTCPSCGKDDKVFFDLNDLKITNPPKADVLYKEVKLPSGSMVRIKAADGFVEEKIETQSTDENAATIGMLARVSEINDRPATIDAIKSMKWKDRSALRKAIDKFEGEMDDKYKASCPHCSHEYEAELPMSAENFFFPTE